MNNERNIVCGAYALNAEGNVYIASRGDAVVLEASGNVENENQGMVQLLASSAISLIAGNTLVGLCGEGKESGVIGLLAPPEGKVSLACGVPEVGPRIQLEPELLKIEIGPPGVGAGIEMTPESITIRIAEVSLTLTPEGITEVVAEVTREVTPEGHNMTAAETDFNIGVEGVSWEGPTESQEVEGGAVENETLGSHTTDAAKNEDAGIAMEV